MIFISAVFTADDASTPIVSGADPDPGTGSCPSRDHDSAFERRCERVQRQLLVARSDGGDSGDVPRPEEVSEVCVRRFRLRRIDLGTRAGVSVLSVCANCDAEVPYSVEVFVDPRPLAVVVGADVVPTVSGCRPLGEAFAAAFADELLRRAGVAVEFVLEFVSKRPFTGFTRVRHIRISAAEPLISTRSFVDPRDGHSTLELSIAAVDSVRAGSVHRPTSSTYSSDRKTLHTRSHDGSAIDV
jgi:hypothetical protein